jgi:hypothetical protein
VQALQQREVPYREAQEMRANVHAVWAEKSREVATQQDRKAALHNTLKEAQLQQETKAHELIALRGQLAGVCTSAPTNALQWCWRQIVVVNSGTC